MENRWICILLAALLLVSVPLPRAEAAALPQAETAPQPEVQVVTLEDGGYLVVTTTVQEGRAISLRNANRTFDFYDVSGAFCWTAKLTGTFQYDGTAAICTASSCTVTYHHANYSQISKFVTQSGATARAEVTIRHAITGITISEKTHVFTLTCDKNGNIT